jgi:beta-glucosidase
MEVRNAIANTLSGTVRQSGRMPATFPKRVEDVPSNRNFPRVDKEAVHYEGLNVRYRALLLPDCQDPLFVFGYGLSYTEFEYDAFVLKAIEGPEPAVKVSVSVGNVSIQVGKEVVQVLLTEY